MEPTKEYNNFCPLVLKNLRSKLLIQDPEPSTFALKMLNASTEDRTKGRVSPTFDKAKDAITWLNNKYRKYAN